MMPLPLLEQTVALCSAGAISPEVALARLALAGIPPETIATYLAATPGPGAVALAARLRSHDAQLRALAKLGGTLDDGAGAGSEAEAIARIGAGFDRAVARVPETSVAAYSLGDPAILASATAEIRDWLLGRGLLPPGCVVLDLGCGIGRVAAALAEHAREVLGLDVSAAMIAEARRRHGSDPRLRFAVTDGRGLEAWPAAVFDLILAVDSFPYLVQVSRDLAARHVRQAARALRPGGTLVVLNLSYRGDPGADRADAAEWAAASGLALTAADERPFRLWDGTAYVFARPPIEPLPPGR